MPRKNRYLTSLDMPAAGKGKAPINAADDIAPSASGTIGAPTGLSLSTGVGYSSAAPTAYIAATWSPPETTTNTLPDGYTIQVSTSSSFTASGTITQDVQPSDPSSPSARVEGLLPGTPYYVRVRAHKGGYPGAWTSASSITTATDTTAAGVPTSITATWIGAGDLLVTWTNPTEANFKDVQVVVRASSGGTIYRTTYSAASRFLYTLAMNIQDTAGAKDSSLYVELKSRTFSNVLGTVVNTGLVTKSAPATPTGVAQSWSGDTGAAGPDLTISWTLADDAYYYRVQLDTINHYAGGQSSHYTYTLAANRSEHAGAPDPAISYSLYAVDGFGQSSTAVSGTATNAAPPTPTVSLTQGFSLLVATVGGTVAGDFVAYEYVFKRDGSTARTLESAASEQQYELSGASDDGYHSWTCVVRQKDAFGQYSSTVTSSAVAFETLTLAGLRARISYTDSISTSPSSLKTAMSDDVRDSGGVSYNA